MPRSNWTSRASSSGSLECGRRSATGGSSILSDAGTDFLGMADVDISRNHGHMTVPVPGRESHTADLDEFDRYVKIMVTADRLEQDLPWDSEGEDSESAQYSDDDGVIGSLVETNRAVAAAAGAPMRRSSLASFARDESDNDVPTGMDIDIDDRDDLSSTAPDGLGFGKPKSSNPDESAPASKSGEEKGEGEELVAPEGVHEKLEELDISSHEGKCRAPPQDRKEEAKGAAAADDNEGEPSRMTYPFNARFWSFVRGILANARPVGFSELSNPNAAEAKGPDDAGAFIGKVIAIGSLNPIQPAALAEQGGFEEDVVLAELFYATLVGLVAMRFAPECIQCGSAVMDTDMLGRVPSRALCNGCGSPNVVESMDKIKVMFLLNSDVLYILAENYACTPSSDSMGVTNVFAPVPANSTGSGYSYSVGTGEGNEIAPALEPGRYRMHCPVAKTDNYLTVEGKVGEKDKACRLKMRISDLVYSHRKGRKKAELRVPHGRIKFDIYPDTQSFFVLWVQKDTDDNTLMHLPDEERSIYTSASTVIHHPIFNALFQNNQVVSVQKNVFLSISNVVLVFTDIVDSTKLYASLGDGVAFKLVRRHFQVLFGAFTRNGGRVVKTIGDAVMASFTTGSAALRAVSEAMEVLPSIGCRPDNGNFVEIRVGIHSGRATVVPLNGVNDYFGQTANIAARVQSAAKACECFITDAVLNAEDAWEEYESILSDGRSFQATPNTELTLKGVDGPVKARGFRKVMRSRRESDFSASSAGLARKGFNRSYSVRNSSNLAPYEEGKETDD